MHELSIALSIIDIAEEVATREGGCGVVAIHLKLGPLSGVVKDALQSAFALACEGSSLGTPSLQIEEVPLRGFCPGCACERPIESLQHLVCSECGTATSDVTSGRQLEIVAMEIES